MPDSRPGGFKRLVSHLLGWLIGAPVLIVFVAFAISNRQDVTLGLWPLPVEATLPLSLLLLGLTFGGLLLGMLLGWIAQHRMRVEARANKREAARLRGMIAAAPTVTAGDTTTTLITARTLTAASLPASPLQ